MQVARPLSDLTLVGIGGGTYPFGFFTGPQEVSLQTTYWGSITELMELLALARRGIVKAEYTTYSLADAPKAYDALRAGTLRGQSGRRPCRHAQSARTPRRAARPTAARTRAYLACRYLAHRDSSTR